MLSFVSAATSRSPPGFERADMTALQNRRVAWSLAPIFYFVVFALQVQGQAPDTARKAAEPFFTVRDVYGAGGFAAGMLGLALFDERLARGIQAPEHQQSTGLRNAARVFRFMGEPAPQIIGPSLY